MARIAAIVTAKKETIAGGAPIFAVDRREGLQPLAFLLEKILDASAHELNEDTFLIVDRS